MRHLVGTGTGHKHRLSSALDGAIHRHKLSTHGEINQSLYRGLIPNLLSIESPLPDGSPPQASRYA